MDEQKYENYIHLGINDGYIHLCDHTHMIQYFKDKNPDTEENHCICKSCEMTCRKNKKIVKFESF